MGQRNNGKVVKCNSVYQCSKVWHLKSLSKHKAQMDTLPPWVLMFYCVCVYIYTHIYIYIHTVNTIKVMTRQTMEPYNFTSWSSLFPWTLVDFTTDQEGSAESLILILCWQTQKIVHSTKKKKKVVVPLPKSTQHSNKNSA